MKTQTTYSAWYPSFVPFFQFRYRFVMLGAFLLDFATEWRMHIWKSGDE